SAANHRSAAVSVCAVQRQGSRPAFDDETAACNDSGKRCVASQCAYGKVLPSTAINRARTRQRTETEKATGIGAHRSTIKIVSRPRAYRRKAAQPQRATALQRDRPAKC